MTRIRCLPKRSAIVPQNGPNNIGPKRLACNKPTAVGEFVSCRINQLLTVVSIQRPAYAKRAENQTKRYCLYRQVDRNVSLGAAGGWESFMESIQAQNFQKNHLCHQIRKHIYRFWILWIILYSVLSTQLK